MVESTIYPKEIELDTLKNGIARLLVHPGDVAGILKDDQLFYQYEEVIIDNFEIPLTYQNGDKTITISSRTDVEAYINSNSTVIIDKVKAKTLSV